MKTLTQTIVDELNKDINREIEGNEGHIYPDTESYIEGLKRAIKMVEAHALVEKMTLKQAYQHRRPCLTHYEDGSAFEMWYNEAFDNAKSVASLAVFSVGDRVRLIKKESHDVAEEGDTGRIVLTDYEDGMAFVAFDIERREHHLSGLGTSGELGEWLDFIQLKRINE